MKGIVNTFIFLLAVALVFLIAGKTSVTGAVIGVSDMPNIVYFPLTIFLFSSLILLMSFRKWAIGGLAALVLAGGASDLFKKDSKELVGQRLNERQRVQEVIQREYGKTNTVEIAEPSALRFHGQESIEYGINYGGNKATSFFVDKTGKLIGVQLYQENGKPTDIRDEKKLKSFEGEYRCVVKVSKQLYGSPNYFDPVVRASIEKILFPKNSRTHK